MNAVSTAVGWKKEGWGGGGRWSSSVINKLGEGAEQSPDVINKLKGHCLRISTAVGRRPEERRGGCKWERVCIFGEGGGREGVRCVKVRAMAAFASGVAHQAGNYPPPPPPPKKRFKMLETNPGLRSHVTTFLQVDVLFLSSDENTHTLRLCSRSERQVQHPSPGCEIQAADPQHQPDAGAQLQVSFRNVLARTGQLVQAETCSSPPHPECWVEGGDTRPLLPVKHFSLAFNKL